MAVTLTYDGTLSRVQVSVTGLDARVDTVTVERSVDQVSWTTVRGGSDVPVVSNAAEVDDYEFTDGVVNYYRVRGHDAAAITFVAAGAASTAVNASVTPALPAGLAQHDLLLVFASIRNSGAGVPNTPSGYTLLVDMANAKLFGKRAGSGEVAPTVTFTGGVANADTIGQCAAFRNAELTPVTTNTQLNSSAQNVDYPAMAMSADDMLAVFLGWKQDDWTSVATLAGASEIGEPDTTTGDDAGQVWDYQIQTTAADVAAGAFAVTGGASAISRGGVVAFEPQEYLSEETEDITPALTAVWLKSITRPFLNRSYPTCVNVSDITSPTRHGVFEVLGRSYPVAVTDVRGSDRFTVSITTKTLAEYDHLRLTLAGGDPLLLQAPAGSPIPTAYVVVEDVTRSRPAPWSDGSCDPETGDPLYYRRFTLPMIEVAAPSADVVGSTYTWQGVLNDYATWADVIADNPTWADLLDNVGSATDVIVP